MTPSALSTWLHKAFKFTSLGSPDEPKVYRQNLAYRIMEDIRLDATTPLSSQETEQAEHVISETSDIALQPMQSFIDERCKQGADASRCIYLNMVSQLQKVNEDPGKSDLRNEWRQRRDHQSDPNSQEPLFIKNAIFSYTEILEVAAIALADFEKERGRWPNSDERKSMASGIKKVILNNASSHNSIGGSLLHLYLDAAQQGLQVFSFKDGQITHPADFVMFTLDKLKETNLVLTNAQNETGEMDLERILGYLDSKRDLPATAPDDPLHLTLHFWGNATYSKSRVGCPFLRLKQLPHYVSGLLTKFFEPA